MNILVVCANGMFSSLLARNLRQETRDRGNCDFQYGFCSVDAISQHIEETDIIVLCSHARYLAAYVEEKAVKQSGKRVAIVQSKQADYMNPASTQIILNTIQAQVSKGEPDKGE